ncbi:MAG TPA: 5-oxoprolinase subunit PxpB [Stellaceae bacterium]|nr:5-oxoprolinase subunit PxpB [Stellaceae bacterium]
MAVRFLSAGDRALVVEFGDRVDPELSDKVLRLDARLRAAPLPGVVETVPTFRSLTLYYDPLVTGRRDLEPAVRGLLGRRGGGRRGARLWHIPICYEAPFAPDLAEVARLTGLAPAEVAERHSAPQYRVYMIGFLPGFPYLGDLPAELALQRRADPRVKVPAGSVAIATNLSAIYPYESPGGWHLIGATPVRLFAPERAPPALLAAGDGVRFAPVDAARFGAIRSAAAAGDYPVANEAIGE